MLVLFIYCKDAYHLNTYNDVRKKHILYLVIILMLDFRKKVLILKFTFSLDGFNWLLYAIALISYMGKFFFFILNIRQYFEWYYIVIFLMQLSLVQSVFSDDCAGFFQNHGRDALLFLKVKKKLRHSQEIRGGARMLMKDVFRFLIKYFVRRKFCLL